jgi:capsid portal protein
VIPIIFAVLFLVILSLVIHGLIVMKETHGYIKCPEYKIHPEMRGVKAGEELIVMRLDDEDLKELHERILRQKMEELFEEPSTYEDELDED